MTESKRRPRSLKGAVLIMVVTILFILIVMLLATLAVVSSSTQRTYTKYEETQAYYTARSALEVYIKEMLECKEPATDVYQTAAYNAMVAGGFQTPIYDAAGNVVSSKVEHDFTEDANPIDYSFAHQQEIFGYLRPKYQWKGGTDFTKKESSDNWELSKWTEKDYTVEYWAQLPSLTSGVGASSKGGILSDDLNGDGVNNDVRIKVELLRVLYRNGDTLVSDRSGRGTFDNPMSTLSSDSNYINWDDTYYRLKVTATTSVLGSEVSVSVLLEPQPVSKPSGFKNAMTSIDNTDIDTKLRVIGGAAANNGSGKMLQAKNDSQIIGTTIMNGGMALQVNSGKDWWLSKNQYVVSYGGPLVTYSSDPTVYGNGTSSDPVEERPFIYADGIAINGKWGTSNNMLDIFASSRNAPGGNTLYDKRSGTHADAIGFPACNSPAENENIAFTMGYNGNDVIYGDVYVDGDMYINGSAGNGTVNIMGSIYCNGTIYVNEPKDNMFQGAEVYCAALVKASDKSALTIDKVSTSATLDTSHASSIFGPEGFTIDPTKQSNPAKINYGPRAGVNSGNFNIPTTHDVTETYYKKDNPDELIPAEQMFQNNAGADAYLDIKSHGGLLITDSLHTYMKNKPVSEHSQFVEVTDEYGNKSPKEYKVTGHYINPADSHFSSSYNSNTGTYDLVFDFNVNNGNTWNNENEVYIIDSTDGPVHVQFIAKDNNFSSCHPTFIFIDENPVTITMQGSSEYDFAQDLGIYNMQLYSMLNNNELFDLGEETKGKGQPRAPKIYYYIDVPKLHRKDGGGNKAMWCGYLYAPKTAYWSNGTAGYEVKYTYNKSTPPGSVSPTGNIQFAGSVVFGSIEMQNDAGAMFIKSAGGGSSGGAGTGIKWSKQKYLNS